MHHNRGTGGVISSGVVGRMMPGRHTDAHGISNLITELYAFAGLVTNPIPILLGATDCFMIASIRSRAQVCTGQDLVTTTQASLS